MSEAENTRVVQDAYAAFGRGDIPALLGYFTDDIQWQPSSARRRMCRSRAPVRGRRRSPSSSLSATIAPGPGRPAGHSTRRS